MAANDYHDEATTPLGSLMTPAEVARFFHVDPKTVTRWAHSGKLSCLRTLGGHRRFKREEVETLLHENHKVASGRSE